MFGSRRRQKRKNLIYYLEVIEQATGKLAGHLIDITTGGILLICENSMEIGNEVKLRIVLPDQINGESSVDFAAECVHCSVSANTQYFDVGFQFRYLHHRYFAVIEQLMKDYGFSE